MNDLNIDEIASVPEHVVPENWQDSAVIFFCRECNKVVPVDKIGKKKISFKCKQCGKKDIAFGTERSISNFFHLDEKKENN